MRRALIGMIVIGICCPAMIAVAQEAKKASRTWASPDGEHSIQAVFISYDSDSRLVTLGLADGSEVDVSIDDLSGRDKSYVAGFLPKRLPLPEILKPKKDKERAQDTTSSDEGPAVRPGPVAGKKLFGLNWQTDPQRALNLATGKEGPADDRPVVWFRVLGDLAGLM